MRRRRESSTTYKKVIVYLIGFFMISSIFGVIFFGFRGGTAATGLSYNGFDIVFRGDVWSANIDGKQALFTYPPTDLEIILADNGAIEKLRNVVQIDVTSDFNDTYAEGIALAQFQMKTVLSNFNIFSRSGFTNNQTSFPTITCEHALQHIPVIYFKSGNLTRILLEDNCVIVEAATYADIIRAKDRLVYGILEIMR